VEVVARSVQAVGARTARTAIRLPGELDVVRGQAHLDRVDHAAASAPVAVDIEDQVDRRVVPVARAVLTQVDDRRTELEVGREVDVDKQRQASRASTDWVLRGDLGERTVAAELLVEQVDS
jgi:hypothetical protein